MLCEWLLGIGCTRCLIWAMQALWEASYIYWGSSPEDGTRVSCPSGKRCGLGLLFWTASLPARESQQALTDPFLL